MQAVADVTITIPSEVLWMLAGAGTLIVTALFIVLLVVIWEGGT